MVRSRQLSPTRSGYESPLSSSSSTTQVDRIPFSSFSTRASSVQKPVGVAYTIGGQAVTPLITLEDLKHSLRILGAFHQLEQDVRDQSKLDCVPIELAADMAWDIYLRRAVYRFQLWTKKVVGDVRPNGIGFTSIEIPPLDVALIWHTYLLVRVFISLFETMLILRHRRTLEFTMKTA